MCAPDLPDSAPGDDSRARPTAERLGELSELADRLSRQLATGNADPEIAERFLAVSREALHGSSMLELLREAEREREENRMLMQVSMKLSSAGGMHEVLRAILESLRQIVQFSAAGIFVYNADQGQFEVDLMVGYEGVDRPKLHEKFREGTKVGKGIVANVLFGGEPIYVPDVSLDSRYVAVRQEARSELAVPIKMRDEVVGVFNLESDELDGLTVVWPDQWFNLRPSNTEPVLRLNVEAPDEGAVERLVAAVQGVIEGVGGVRT